MADISIHTTTQVVTGMLYAFHGFLCYFNPHHHAGGDPMGGMMPGMSGDFNPHHHAGGDKPQTITRLSSWNFNPHHHAGGDTTIWLHSHVIPISIHTTTQVVTETEDDFII